MRTFEGQGGSVSVYVVPSIEPKFSLVRKYMIRPLSLHERISSPFDTAR